MFANCGVAETPSTPTNEELNERLEVIEFEGAKPTPSQEVYNALGNFYADFRSDFQQGISEVSKIGTELVYLRREVTVNTVERTENTRQIAEGKGEIKSLWNAVNINRALLLSIFGIIFGIIRKLYKKQGTSEKSKSIIIKP